MASNEKNEWKTEFKQIKKKINSFDTEILKLFPFIHTTTLKNELILLANNEEKSTFDRTKEREEIFVNLSFLRKDIRSFKEKIKYFDKTEENLKKIEEITLNLESKISDFQAKQMNIFDELTNEEERFTNDLEIFSNRLDNYENTVKLAENKQKKIYQYRSEKVIKEEGDFMDKNNNNNNDPEYYEMNGSFLSNKENRVKNNDSEEENDNEIENIEQELLKLKKNIEIIDKNIRNNGGISCSWPEEDHNDFLKLRTKHKNNINKNVFLEDCVSALPLYTKQDIKVHIEKFKALIELENEKKGLVENYKLLKDEKKRKMLDLINEEQTIQQEKLKENEKNRAGDREKQKKLKEHLKEWKIKRMSTKELENEKKMQEELEGKKMQEKKIQEKKAQNSLRIKEYKEIKEKQQKIEEKIQRKIVDPLEMERIRLKEEKLILRRKELFEKKKNEQEEKKNKMQRLLETKNVKFGYVESKLTEETKAIIGKKTEKFDPKKGDQPKFAETFGGMLGKGPSRAIPSWRQGG